MRVRRGHHVSFAVHDLARARRFYGEVLGLDEIPRPDFGFPGAWYRAGEIEVHLIQVPAGVDVGAPPPAISGLANHAAFQIDDYEAALAHLARHGVEHVPTRPEVGQIFTRDPDGNGIELIVPGGRLGRTGTRVPPR